MKHILIIGATGQIGSELTMDGKVIVAKHSTACVFCSKPTRVQIGEQHICPACAAKYQAQFDEIAHMPME